jgi:hypothetical protein
MAVDEPGALVTSTVRESITFMFSPSGSRAPAASGGGEAGGRDLAVRGGQIRRTARGVARTGPLVAPVENSLPGGLRYGHLDVGQCGITQVEQAQLPPARLTSRLLLPLVGAGAATDPGIGVLARRRCHARSVPGVTIRWFRSQAGSLRVCAARRVDVVADEPGLQVVLRGSPRVARRASRSRSASAWQPAGNPALPLAGPPDGGWPRRQGTPQRRFLKVAKVHWRTDA